MNQISYEKERLPSYVETAEGVRVTFPTCGIVPGGQADGLLQETQLGVVKSESLVDDVGIRLHVHLKDDHRLVIFCSERHLWKEIWPHQHHASPQLDVRSVTQHLHHHRAAQTKCSQLG